MRKRGSSRSAGTLEALDQPLPELLLHAHDDEPAVGGAEASGSARGSDARPAGGAAGCQSRLSVQIGQVVQHRDGGVEQRDVDVAADAGRPRAMQADHQRQRRQDAAGEVDDRDAALGRRRVRLAGDAHEAGVGLQQVVVGRLAAARTGAAEAGERAADDARVDVAQARRSRARASRGGRRAGCCRPRRRARRGGAAARCPSGWRRFSVRLRVPRLKDW